MLDKEIIKPSRSQWASPVSLVKKKDGSVRFCVHYRQLNKLTKKDVYPLPRIDDTLNSLGKCSFFSTLDLTSGYYQIFVAPEDQEKIAFISHSGLYEFTVMPFVLTNAPATFRRDMDIVFARLKWLCCLIYLDDIIIFSRTFEEHKEHLKFVFDRMKEFNLKIKGSKCSFCREDLILLGLKVTADGISPDPKKVEAIFEIVEPRNKSDLRTFLGLTGYYRKFIEGFAKIASCLYELTHENSEYALTEEHRSSFEKLKALLSQYPVLRHPIFNYPFIVQTDASEVGLGAVLCQSIDEEERVIEYISRSFQPAERKWSVREKEALGILWACEQFRPFIIGTKFVIVTDHESLK